MLIVGLWEQPPLNGANKRTMAMLHVCAILLKQHVENIWH